MFQRWADLLFLHWPIAPSLLAETLPAGLHLDTFQGQGYLGIVPFHMQRVRPRFLPCVPGLSWFLELNLRTYVYDDQGRPGVWFYSLDANQTIAVELARTLFHLPYQHAKMSATHTGNELTFRSQRRHSPDLAQYHYRGAGDLLTATPDSLEFFLLERYLLFSTTRTGALKIGQVHHQPYPYQRASCDPFSTLPFDWNGFLPPASAPVSSLYSPGVDVEIFPLRKAS